MNGMFNNFTNFNIFICGNIGVEFFYILSGILMAKSGKRYMGISKNLIPDYTWTFIKNKINHFIGSDSE